MASSPSSFHPRSASAAAARPISRVSGPLTAAVPSFHRAWATMAMMTGPTPYITQPSCGVSPTRDVGPGQTPDDEGGGQDEAGAGEEQPESAAASIPEMNRHLGRVGSRNEVGRAQQVEELGVGQPPLGARTTSSRIMAMCAAGPPKAVVPRRRKSAGELGGSVNQASSRAHLYHRDWGDNETRRTRRDMISMPMLESLDDACVHDGELDPSEFIPHAPRGT